MKPTVIGYINEQPKVLRNVVAKQDLFVKPFVKEVLKNNTKKIIFFGSGTSFNVANIAAYYFKHIVGIDAQAQYPTVFVNYEKADWSGRLKKDEILFVGISQSGTSRSTVATMQYAKKNGYPSVVITGNAKSIISKYAKVIVPLLVGKELTPPETKGYTVSVLSMYLWAIGVAKATKKITPKKYNEYLQDAKDLSKNFEKVIAESKVWYEANKCSIIHSNRIYVLGYGVDYGSALEGQLKIGEMLRLPVTSYEIEEYSHGPTMAIQGNQTIIIFGSDEKEYQRMLLFRKTFQKYTSRVHVITNKKLKGDTRDIVFSVKTNKYLAPIEYTVPCQFVAAYGARDIGIDTAIDPFEESLAHSR